MMVDPRAVYGVSSVPTNVPSTIDLQWITGECENEADDEMGEKLASERQLEAARQRIAMEQELQETCEFMMAGREEEEGEEINNKRSKPMH